MKKFIACSFVLLICLALSCTKEELLCGCSPINDSFTFIVKNQQGLDLLNPSTPGSYNKANLRVTYNNAGSIKTAPFNVADPFPTSSNIDFPFYYVNTSLGFIYGNLNLNEAYIDFGNGDIDTLNFSYDKASNLYTQVKLNNKTMPAEPLSPDSNRPVYVVVK